MSQFRPLPSFHNNDVPVMTEETPDTGPLAPSPTATSTTTLPEPTTGQLSFPPLNAQQLTALAHKSSVYSTTGRLLHIPATTRREPTTDKLPRPTRRMSRRLRHGLIFFAIFFVLVITLLSLSPLNNGQSNIPLIGGISNWIHAQQLNWQLQSQGMQQITQGNPSQNMPTPPPMDLPKSQYIAIAQQDALNAGISPTYFVRQIDVESGFNPNAYSYAGAEGIAQFEPATAAGLGINPWDPIQSLAGAARLMANYSHNYGGNYAMALAAYNGGSGTVQYAVNACGPSAWMNCLPGQTQHYIYEIMGV